MVVITQNSNIANIPGQMVGNMIYLKMMNGETYLYLSKVFQFFANSNIPFLDVKNPFQKSFASPNCTVAPKFYQDSLDCSIMVNYDIDILLIYFTLAINIVLSLIHYLTYGVIVNIHKRHQEWEKVEVIDKSRGFRIATFLKENYAAIVDSHYFYSYVVSVLLVCYYIWSAYKYIRLLLHLKPRLDTIRNLEKRLREQAENPAKHRAMPLNYYVDSP